MSRVALLAVVTTSSLIAACSGDDGGTAGGPAYFVSLDADDLHYEQQTSGGIANADGTFTFAAEFDPAHAIGVSLTAPLEVGTFPTGVGKNVFIMFNSADNSFTVGGSRGAGAFTISSIEGDLVSGTFAGDGISVDGTNTPVSITNGTFQFEIVIDNR